MPDDFDPEQFYQQSPEQQVLDRLEAGYPAAQPAFGDPYADYTGNQPIAGPPPQQPAFGDPYADYGGESPYVQAPPPIDPQMFYGSLRRGEDGTLQGQGPGQSEQSIRDNAMRNAPGGSDLGQQAFFAPPPQQPMTPQRAIEQLRAELAQSQLTPGEQSLLARGQSALENINRDLATGANGVTARVAALSSKVWEDQLRPIRAKQQRSLTASRELAKQERFDDHAQMTSMGLQQMKAQAVENARLGAIETERIGDGVIRHYNPKTTMYDPDKVSLAMKLAEQKHKYDLELAGAKGTGGKDKKDAHAGDPSLAFAERAEKEIAHGLHGPRMKPGDDGFDAVFARVIAQKNAQWELEKFDSDKAAAPATPVVEPSLAAPGFTGGPVAGDVLRANNQQIAELDARMKRYATSGDLPLARAALRLKTIMQQNPVIPLDNPKLVAEIKTLRAKLKAAKGP